MSTKRDELSQRIARALDEHEPELDQTACPTGYCSCGDKFSSDAALMEHRVDAVIAELALVEDRGVTLGRVRETQRRYVTPWERIVDDT